MSNDLRKDLQVIADLVPVHAKVLELGCGEGELLGYLTREKKVDGRGIELSQAGVSQAVQNGLFVIQGDIDTDLQVYPDKCFDYVISSQVLQATHKPKDVLAQILRISKHCIVSIPNFGYWRNRLYLALNGRMPVTKALSYQWYETPNIHFCTVDDFKSLCADLGGQIEQTIFLDGSLNRLNPVSHALSTNLFSDKAVFLLRGE